MNEERNQDDWKESYRILQNDSKENLEIFVADHIDIGYICQGGVFVTNHGSEKVYCQAMVLKK